MTDDGVGLPPKADPTQTATLGLRLVSRLAGQLGGELNFATAYGGGTDIHVTFPIPENVVIAGGQEFH